MPVQKKNDMYLLSQLDSDEGARHLGKFVIGTNYGITKFTKSILYDEKIGGSFPMAFDAGFPKIGGKKIKNPMGFYLRYQQDNEIHVDGKLPYKNGQCQL